MLSKLIGCNYDYSLKQWVVSIAVNTTGKAIQDMFLELRDKTCDVTIKKHSEKRSLNANRFYWEMLGQAAAVLNISNGRLHNMLLQKVAAFKYFGNQVIQCELEDTDEVYEQVMEDTCSHLLPVDYPHFSNGKLVRTYYLLKGSSEMDSKEFSRLVDTLMEKLKELNIPTISDAEYERMLAAYGKERASKE